MDTVAVTFDGRRHRRLVGDWHTPSVRPAPGAVVVAHGMLSSRHSPKHRELCDRATAAGFAALRFDFAGRGDSTGSPLDLTVTGEVDDLVAAIAWVRARTAGPVAVVGSSLGGTVAVLAAGSGMPAALVTIAAPAELPESSRPGWTSESAAERSTDGIDEHTSEVPPSFFADAQRHDPVAAARAIRCPWLVIHGAADDVVPMRHAELFVAACPCATPSTHPRAGHRFQSAAHRRWLVGRAIGFLADVLGGRSDRR